MRLTTKLDDNKQVTWVSVDEHEAVKLRVAMLEDQTKGWERKYNRSVAERANSEGKGVLFGMLIGFSIYMFCDWIFQPWQHVS